MSGVRKVVAAIGVGVLVSLTAGCGGQDPAADPESTAEITGAEPSGDRPDDPSTEETATAEPRSEAIEITVEDGEVSPLGRRVEVERGQPIILEVTSDMAGELHVHSSPEQTLEFGTGTTELELTIDQPGVVDVELHQPSVTVLQLEVR